MLNKISNEKITFGNLKNKVQDALKEYSNELYYYQFDDKFIREIL
jgi:hypothetical protein